MEEGASFVSLGAQYIGGALSSVVGLKVLITDNETAAMLSTILTQNDALSKDVTLVTKLEETSNGIFKVEKPPSTGTLPAGYEEQQELASLRQMSAVFFLRPTDENILRLITSLERPRFAGYHLFFTNVLQAQQLARLARYDKQNKIKRIKEFLFDVHANVPAFAFSLDMETLSRLPIKADQFQWSPFEVALFQRMCHGVFSALLLVGRGVLTGIRYSGKSYLCRRVATEVNILLQENRELADIAFSRDPMGNRRTILFIYDRRDDPVTPLLIPWTYQAMIHENLGIRNGRVALPSTAPGADVAGEGPLNEVVLSLDDPFFAQHWHSDFGVIGTSIQDLLRQFQDSVPKKGNHLLAGTTSVGDIQALAQDFPELKRRSQNVHKHVAIGHILNSHVTASHLMDISLLEQDIACNDNRVEQVRYLLEILRRPDIAPFQKLRVTLLFALRYENDPFIGSLRAELKNVGVSNEMQLRLIDAVPKLLGESCRSSDLFQARNLFQRATTAVRGLSGAGPNQLMQHTPKIVGLIEALARNKVKNQQYAWLEPSCAGAMPNAPGPTDILVFVVGGLSGAETAAVHSLRKRLPKDTAIHIGATCVHNAKTFIADLSHLSNGLTEYTDSTGTRNPDYSRADPAVHKTELISAAAPAATELAAMFENPSKELSRDDEINLKRQFLKQEW